MALALVKKKINKTTKRSFSVDYNVEIYNLLFKKPLLSGINSLEIPVLCFNISRAQNFRTN